MTEQPTKTFKKVEISVFETTCRELNQEPGIVCQALGYSSHTFNGWRSEGKMPQVAAIACEALRRRHTPRDEGRTWLVKCLSKSHSDAIEAICRGLGVEYVNI